MKAELNAKESGRPAGVPSHPARPRRSASWRLGIARATRASLACGLFLAAGCAASNYNFEELSEVRGPARAEHLRDASALEQERGEGGELYDIEVTPLLHSHLKVFAPNDDEDVPQGFIETDIAAYLPLFGFVDATIRRYDEDYQMYEHNEYDSYLWGLFQTHREQIATLEGLRERSSHRFLWLFSWRSSPEYVDAPQ